jgi:hypothetical protein
VRVTHVLRLGTQADISTALQGDGPRRSAKHSFYRASESDHPPWNSAGSSHLGHLSTGATASGPPGVVALVQPRERGGTTLPTTDAGDGSRKNQPVLDNVRGALLPLAARFRLRGIQTRGNAVSCRGEMGEDSRRSTRMKPHSKMR